MRRPRKISRWQFHLVFWGNLLMAVLFLVTLALFFLGIWAHG